MNAQQATQSPVVSADFTKEAICNALRAWINQRPGLEFGNYGEASAYRSEMRSITRDRADALQILRYVELRDSITANMLIAAFPRAYSGRLSLDRDPKGRMRLDYCTGQYWPTEYRRAAAAVLASAVWDWMRSSMPKNDALKSVSPGDYLRNAFKREFGRSIQKRWFD